MTGPAPWTDPGHGSWEELAVGQALGALEPEDEEAFLLHLRGCAPCERLLVDVEVGASELAYAPAQIGTPDKLRRKVASIVGADSRPAMLPGAVRQPRRTVRLTRPATWGRPWVAFTIGVVVIVGLSLWNLVLQSDSSTKQNELAQLRTVARCAAEPACLQVKLVSNKGAPNGLVQVRGDRATVVLYNVAPNERSTLFYLWQKPVAGTPAIAVGAFNVSCHDVCVIEQKMPLPLSLSVTKQFIVTLEVAKPAPSLPGPTPIAIGDVASSS
ncbi:MAG: hypothetical protein QOG53_847 [Frankiales bacterium]|nr:hypothetical protein [Frankiales bacterium]